MSTIDLIVLGIIKKEPLSAYDIQKLVEYRKISQWVKISTPSIYKKVIQLEQKGLIKGKAVKEGKMPEKVVYYLTQQGEKAFTELMFSIADEPVNFYLDFNSVIVNLLSMSPQNQLLCIKKIKDNVVKMKQELQSNINKKNTNSDIPQTGFAVLKQQMILAQAIETWLESLDENFNS